MLTLKQVKENKFVQEFITQSEKYLDDIGYTDHGRRHISIVSDRARSLAKAIGLSEREQEMCAIVGYCHDMGNFLGRTDHHYWSSMLFMQTFLKEVENSEDLSIIMQAIASHDKDELKIVNPVSAILILADKSDVHKTRVKTKKVIDINSDIHDRVNYAAIKNDFSVNKLKKDIKLKIQIDTKLTNTMDYFEIFIARMTFCKLAADYLGYNFTLIINNFKLS